MFKDHLRCYRASLIGSTAALALFAGAAKAQTGPISMPGQPLSAALIQVAEKTGESIIFSQQSLEGIQAPPIDGKMSAKEAVERLIEGTDLEIASIGVDGMVVRRPLQKQSDASAAPVEVAQRPAPVQVAQAAPAQSASDADGSGIEQVVVSASRIAIAGYQAPTPVTVVGAAELERDAQSDIGNVIRNLPAFGGSTSPDNSNQAGLVGRGNGGLNEVNLRNLGVLRTLVLINGQRVVMSDIVDAAVDLSTIPSTLLQRVDVVTGGASASWGSDAVAGVVNLILDTNLDGFRASIQGNDNAALNHGSAKIEAAYGMDLDGGRAHLIVSGSYYASPQSYFASEAPWAVDTALVTNPAYAVGNGQPKLIHSNDRVGSSQETQGGLITSGPLAGIQFVGPNAALTPFYFGNVSGGKLSNGGSAESELAYSQFSVPIRNRTAFIYGKYKLTDNILASLQLNYGGSSLVNGSALKSDLGDITITSDNAYIPPALATLLTAQKIKSFKFGTDNSNNIVPNEDNLSSKAQGMYSVAESHRQLLRAVASLEGSIGNDWTWNAYVQYGGVRLQQIVINNADLAYYNNAIDAVTVSAANVGSSGLPIGTIACRSTLTNPINGCQPLDLFGNGVASAAAIKYIEGPARAGGDTAVQIMTEDVAEASIQGKLPWGLPAGQMALTFGGTYRKEANREDASPLAKALTFVIGNFTDFPSSSYNTKEGFGEIDVPVLKDNIVQSLDLNMAGRLTDYSTSGLVETWKLGLTSQVNDDFRLRTTWSFDIRAPDIYELFAVGQYALRSSIDPKTGLGVSIYDITGGNPNLAPETAVTVSGGVVLTPHWFEGLSVSLDWYSISLKRVIVVVAYPTVVANCAAGQALYCSQLQFGGPGGALSAVLTDPINADSQTVSGLDFQADYGMDFLSGRLSYHLVGNYTDEQTQTTQGVTYDYAGSIGGDSPYHGSPKFKATAAATYDQRPWSATVQGRFIGTARLNNAWGPLDVDNNNVPAVAYLDLRTSYNWNDNIQLYGAVDNALDKTPPVVTSSAAFGGGGVGTETDLYDVYGRMFRVGIRLRY